MMRTVPSILALINGANVRRAPLTVMMRPSSIATACHFRPRGSSQIAVTIDRLPEHLEMMMEELESGEAQLFDVREEREAATGKLKQSLLAPLSKLQAGFIPPYDK